MGFDMNGKTAGIIGTGKIARILIRILKGFGMNILAYDPYPDRRFAEEAGITYTTLDDLYARSDIISLHCPLTPETEHLINTDSIGKMKEGVMIINTGRGKLINTEMLIDGLKSKKWELPAWTCTKKRENISTKTNLTKSLMTTPWPAFFPSTTLS